ncbi:hypothetical protein J5J86_14140 [Aquabacter sp. L1I39]|uniref:hypothetical protein n=1 Tax=Aquabacter sp. L1I39 TaxID=2820278 RepID=UPI001ADA32B1|nr:hypothetical protein [Aquabacter sp. L1I39]QTL01946.1 hypothetical protein J5J86_14140 [Aquabacter sp. L1I39]
MASAATLHRRRREMAAAYATATRRHAPRAALHRHLVQATCEALKAELRAARRASAAQQEPDLFSQPGATP